MLNYNFPKCPISVHEEIFEQEIKIKGIRLKIKEGKLWEEKGNELIKAIEGYITYLKENFLEVGIQED